MLKLLIDERDLRNQMDYLRGLNDGEHETQQIRSREVRQLQWVMLTSKPLNYVSHFRIIDRKIIEDRVILLHANSLNTKDEQKQKINDAKIAQLQWCVRNSEPIWEETAVKKTPVRPIEVLETKEWSWRLLRYITKYHDIIQ